MGQKVNPIIFRVTVTKDWRSRWFARKDQEYGTLLIEDIKLRNFVKERLKHAAVARIQIERFANRVRITVHSARPGIVFGRRRQDLDLLKEELQKIAQGKDIYLDVVEVRKQELCAQLVAESIAQQLERRVSFRRAMKKAIQAAMDMGALGVRIRVGGRLNGAELARTEQLLEGSVPLHTLRANVDYGFAEANTVAGKIGVKVWIHLPEPLLEDKESTYAVNAQKSQIPQDTKRKSGRKRQSVQ